MADWRRGGVIYQVYPRSFCDSNDDGVGDLNGLASRVGYVRSLGVDGIWLSPFFRSPMKDFGYDVSDYRDVDPIFGSLGDFDRLLATSRAAGLKVVIDQVYSHTSDRHPWFDESRASRDNARAQWYHWADAKSDGTPPNNWLSVFGGPAWTWDSRRRQYYLHNFLIEQPDLNFHNPDVRAAILDVARFWLDRGVDGFRLDVANYYYCDAELRDNPPKRPEGGFARPYQHQRHIYDRSQPETLAFIEELRRLVDRYPGRLAVAEIGSDSPLERSMEYTSPGRLHTAYNFLFLESSRLTPALIRSAFDGWTADDAWPSWSFSNHDFPRAPTRFGGRDASPAYARLLLGLLFALRGTIFLYQGEELGLPQADVSREHLRDPEGIRFWPHSLGRDGCRTPMPWLHNAAHAGFSMVEPWLPVDPRHRALAVDVQEKDRNSTLNAARRFIAARRAHAALRNGAIDFMVAPDPVVAFRRTEGRSCVFCAFNLGAEPASLPAPAGRVIDYGLGGALERAQATLPAYGGLLIDESA
jgi:alpha-glucosidase